MPTPGDTVIFDGLGVGNCTMDIPIDVAGIKIQATYTGVITQGANTILVRNIGFTQAGGSFVGGTAKIDLLGEFNLFGGTFTSTSDTLIVGHKSYALANATIFTHSGGSFQHNNGIVKFSPEGFNANIFTVDVLPGDRFFDIEIDARNANNSGITSALGDTIYALNNIIHNDGEAEGYFALLGNLIINPNASGGGKAGYFMFLGTANQTWEYTGAVVPTSGFLINKTAGNVSPKAGTTDLYCTLLEIQQGVFNAPTGILKIGHNFENWTNFTVFKHSGGIFNHNNGLTWFAMTGYWANNFIVDVLPGDRFYDVKIDIANQDNVSLTVTTGDTLYALNNLTHSDGLANGNYALNGNLIIDATAVPSSSGWFMFLGSVNQTWEYTTVPVTTNGILIDKTVGTVSTKIGTPDLYCAKLELRSGTFNAPTGSLKIGMNYQNSNTTVFKHTGGTFNHNNGLTWFAVTGYWANIFTVDVLPGDRFYDVKIDISNQDNVSLTVVTGDTLYALNNLTHSDGLADGNYALKGNLIIDATAMGGNGWFMFLGTTNQTWEYTTVPAVTNGILIDKTAGMVSPKVGTTDLYCARFEQRNTTFNAPTGTMKLTHLWKNSNATVFNHIGGIFKHNNVTVYFNPDGYWNNTFTVNVLPGDRFGNVIVEVPRDNTCKLSIATGDTLYSLNNLTLMDGMCSNGHLAAEGNVTVQSLFTGGTTPLHFLGVKNQNFDLTGATALFDANIYINKTTNNVALLSACTLDNTSQTLTLTNGNIISTATNLLTLGNTVTVSGASVTSFVSGPIKKIGNASFTFPTGTVTTGVYAPISMSAPVNITDAFTAEYINIDPNTVPYSNISKDASLNHISQCEYWILNRTTGLSNVNVTLSWDTHSCGVSSLADLRIARWDGAVWRDHGIGGTTGTAPTGTITTAAPVTAFSPFTLASVSGANVLPIELLTFNALLNKDKVELNWTTATETNNTYFEVERSADGKNWKDIITTNGAGNSSQLIEYFNTDYNPSLGESYYRLKQIDLDGNYSYSNIVMITYITKQQNEIVVYPNPSNGSIINLNFNGEVETDFLIAVKDMQGKEILSKQVTLGNNYNSTNLIDQENLPKGMYLITATSNTQKYSQKLIVN